MKNQETFQNVNWASDSGDARNLQKLARKLQEGWTVTGARLTSGASGQPENWITFTLERKWTLQAMKSEILHQVEMGDSLTSVFNWLSHQGVKFHDEFEIDESTNALRSILNAVDLAWIEDMGEEGTYD